MEEFSPKTSPNFLKEVSFSGWLLSLADYFLDLYKDNKNLFIVQQIMNFIEKIIPETDENTQGEIEVCFFESIINSLGEDEIKLKEFFKLLGPHSIELCKENDTFWGTHTKGLHED